MHFHYDCHGIGVLWDNLSGFSLDKYKNNKKNKKNYTFFKFIFKQKRIDEI